MSTNDTFLAIFLASKTSARMTRDCGACSLCCKLTYVAELQKPSTHGVRIAGSDMAAARSIPIGRLPVGALFAAGWPASLKLAMSGFPLAAR